MTENPYQRGDVVWHPAPFKKPPNERPFLILSGDSHPYQGSEYAVVGLTRNDRPPAVKLPPSAWATGNPGGDSYASPWYLFTLKHIDILRPKGALMISATDQVARAVAGIIGVK